MTWAFPRSLFGQLLLSQVVLFLFLALTLPALVLVTLHRTADDYVAARLGHDASVLAVVIDKTGAEGRDVATRALGPAYGDRWGSRAYRITNATGGVLVEGGLVQALPPPLRGGSVPEGFVKVGDLDIFRRTVSFDGRAATLEIAQDRTRPEVIVDDVVSTFLERALWIIPVILAASAALALLLVYRVVRQLRVVSEQADRINPDTLDTRLTEKGLPLEARRLAASTNRALDRVETAYRRQTQFVANVAHELRTPIALVTLRSDALPPSPEREALRDAIDQTSHVVSQLMELARLEGRPPVLEQVSLEAIARGVIEATAPIVYRSGRSLEMIEGEGPAAPVTGNAGLLHIAVANLIDNAVRHTPPGTHISVGAASGTITISDNGPGILVERQDDGHPRYRSAGQQRSDSAGLGLSIVARIMAAMHGELEIRAGSPGTIVVLRLPGGDVR